MKYVLIGCGRIALKHIEAARANGLEIAAVCDAVPDKMETLLYKTGLGNEKSIGRYTDYREILASESPLLAAVATDSGLHAEIALACLDNGANAIVEKPVALSMADAEKIILKAEETGLKIAVCHQNRFNAAVTELRRAIDGGRFGRLSHGSVCVRWNRGESYYRQAAWRGKWNSDGGCLMNQCIHGIDLLRWTMGGEISEVYGQTRRRLHPYIEGEDAGAAVVCFKNGAFATIEGTVNVYPENLEETLCIFGEKGTVKLGGKNCNTVEVWNFAGEESRDEVNRGLSETASDVYGNGHLSLYADMIGAIESGRAPYVDAYAGRDALELVLAIYKSQKEGRPVGLPLSGFSSADMRGTF